MDLIAGYGSGSESDDESLTPPPATIKRPAVDPAPAAPSNSAASKPGSLFASLPGPRNTVSATTTSSSAPRAASSLPSGFFDNPADAETAVPVGSARPAGLPTGFFDTSAAVSAAPRAADADDKAAPGPAPPAPAPPADLPQPTNTELWKQLPAAGKRKVLFRPQINMELLAGSDSDDDDDGPAAKKARPAAASGKSSILSFLPAPKHTPAAPKGLGANTRLQAPGVSSTAAAGQKQQQDTANSAAAAAGPAVVSNEAYRLAQPAAPAAADEYAQHQGYDQHSYAQYQQQYAAADTSAGYAYSGYDYVTTTSNPTPSSAAVGAAGTAETAHLAPEEAFLQEALQAEASKAARRAAGGGSAQLVMPDIQFKEINADNIKYVDPAQREAAQGMRAALGSDYAAKIRSQAAPHTGSRLARSKHQIGTLFANAKLRELEVLENRAAGMKSKAETAGKYGWR